MVPTDTPDFPAVPRPSISRSAFDVWNPATDESGRGRRPTRVGASDEWPRTDTGHHRWVRARGPLRITGDPKCYGNGSRAEGLTRASRSQVCFRS